MSKGNISMKQNCDLTLKSIVDGSETLFYAKGALEWSDTEIKLVYQEEDASFCLTFCDDEAFVERKGDYTLRLKLVNGELTQGEIGINGNFGELEIRTHNIEASCSEKKLNIRLRYDILLGDEAQEMELFIQGDVKAQGEI